MKDAVQSSQLPGPQCPACLQRRHAAVASGVANGPPVFRAPHAA